jgi:hypothetical protein
MKLVAEGHIAEPFRKSPQRHQWPCGKRSHEEDTGGEGEEEW